MSFARRLRILGSSLKHPTMNLSRLLKTICFFLLAHSAVAQSDEVPRAPERSEGDGPYAQLIIRGATLINGRVLPPWVRWMW